MRGNTSIYADGVLAHLTGNPRVRRVTTPMTPSTIADDLGISETEVRIAMRQLEREGRI